MNILKKILSVIVISILMLHGIQNITCTRAAGQTQKTVKAAVFLNYLDSLLFSDVKKSLEAVQKENNNKMEFTFFDAKGNQALQNEDIAKALNAGFDLFVVKPVSGNEKEIENTIGIVMQANIPLILYLPRATGSLPNIIKAYGKGVIINSDVELSGTLEGQILADAWNANKQTMDKNKDNIMQYVMLQGPSNNDATLARTKYSIQALNEAGIKTQELLSTVCNWNEDCAITTIESAFLTLDGKIEAIISNNDEMAIGAIEALQKYGFNKDDKSKYIPVVGIDGAPKAKELVDKGIMAGTVSEDLPIQANAIYSVGMNLVSGNSPLSGTNYKFDETGITIKIPCYKYVKGK